MGDFGYESPTSGPGGDDDGDDAEAMEYWDSAGIGGIWTPECWHKSPVQLQAEAAAANEEAFVGSMRYAGQHSNPPAPPSWQRPF